MSPGTDERRPPARSGAQGVGETTGLSLACSGVAVIASPPTTGRRRWLAVVTACPYCGQAHAYYADARRLFGGLARRRCPHTRCAFVLLARDPGRVRR